MSDYPIYQKPKSPDMLGQGDILDASILRDNLAGHQDYYANSSWLYRYMVVTQTCDLVRGRPMSDFIFLAVIRRLGEALGPRQLEAGLDSLRDLLKTLYNHSYNRRGFFYLPEDKDNGIEEESVVDLRVMFSLHFGHYPDLLRARCGGLTDVYAAQLGHVAGHMFSRVAVPGWEELNPGLKLNDQIKKDVGVIKNRIKETLSGVLVKTAGKCGATDCEKKATTYRWVPVESEEKGVRMEELGLCEEHARKRDHRG